eukprot:5757658-Lingulodinium_polyedra.AAC.1
MAFRQAASIPALHSCVSKEHSCLTAAFPQDCLESNACSNALMVPRRTGRQRSNEDARGVRHHAPSA